ncbi:MAG: zinc ribbon domain-containing protein [Thermodesulfobacteriota bacterium]
MADYNFINRITSFLNLYGSRKETSYIPPSLKEDILNDIEKDDSLLSAVESLSSTYKPKNWFDRNTFFNTYLILTKKRVIVAKNSSELRIFRDIDLDQIQKYKFSSVKKGHNILEIESFDSIDKIVIDKNLIDEFEYLKNLFEQQFKRTNIILEKVFIFCMHCGTKIASVSKFCSSCGKKVNI